ncbi:MAG: nucleoside-diphosphate sugar epimerase/dehydratase [Deltaproteobacteria bacterium]
MKHRLHLNFFIVLGIDIILVAWAWYFAHLLRFNFSIPPDHFAVMVRVLPIVLVIKILTFYMFDFYRGMWRYTSLNDLVNMIKAASVGSLLIVALILFTHGFTGFSRATFIIDWILTIFFVAGYRAGIRLFFWIGGKDISVRTARFGLFKTRRSADRGGKRLLIIGAGDCGEKIFREIQDNGSLRYRVVGFVDDDENKIGRQIHGKPVLGTTGQLKTIAEKMKVEESLIAVPSASGATMRDLVSLCDETGIPYKTVPGMGELINGKVSVKAIRDVAYRDLLGREVVRLDEDWIGAYLENSRVLVSGAGGSIGSELCRQICRFRPLSLILFERAESALYEIDLELKADFPHVNTVSVLGDIRDQVQLIQAFSAHQPQVVFHAAAYKHVPMMEMQPWKAVRNNILGTRNVVEVAKQHNVDRFVFVSTDKAVRPANVMGATKRVAELLVECQNGGGDTGAKFMIVRFGNVVGSVGSVVPLFKKQIEKGGPVTVTHPEMTRYFMTIPEASQLILQAGAMGKGGEIFILDMGTQVKIVDMARDLIRLSGFEPDVDIQIEYIGLRPGEKLHEELITEGEGIVPTSHEKIMVLRAESRDPSAVNGSIDQLAGFTYEQDVKRIIEKLQELVPEYVPGKQIGSPRHKLF